MESSVGFYEFEMDERLRKKTARLRTELEIALEKLQRVPVQFYIEETEAGTRLEAHLGKDEPGVTHFCGICEARPRDIRNLTHNDYSSFIHAVIEHAVIALAKQIIRPLEHEGYGRIK